MSTDQDIIDWENEAKMVMNDIKNHVNTIEISNLFTDDGVYINIKTIEGESFCIFLNSGGFKVVGTSFDSCDKHEDSDCEVFETIYGLLNKYSAGYTSSFGQELVDKLKEIS